MKPNAHLTASLVVLLVAMTSARVQAQESETPPPAPPVAASEGASVGVPANAADPGPVRSAPAQSPSIANKPAPPPPSPTTVTGFGVPRQVVLWGASALDVGGARWSESELTSFGVSVNTSLDYFLSREFTIGVDFGLGHLSEETLSKPCQEPSTLTRFGASVGPAFGANAPISERITAFPRLSLLYGTSTTNTDMAMIDDSYGPPVCLQYRRTRRDHQKEILVRAFIPVLVHPAPHVFVGGGPYLQSQVSRFSEATRDNLRMSYGFSVAFGLWL